jgi:two-component system, sensor histidine kinase and response regulator
MSQPRILVVDDTEENLNLLANFLEEWNAEVFRAVDGQTAIDLVQGHQPDLILLDIILPDLSGYEVCQYLKSQEDFKDIPIIFISALDTPLDKVKAFECGAVDYITKPFFTGEVIARIENQLKLKELRSQLLIQNQHLVQEINFRKQVEEEILNLLLKMQELNRLKSQFISIISHEFKTPLATIQLATDLLSHHQLSTERREERYQQIKSCIFYMNNLLESAIFTEDLNNKTIELELKTVEFTSFFQNIIDTFKSTLSDTQELITTIEETIQEIRIDTTLTRQIISNLISNAIKYSPKGGKILIDLSSEAQQIIFKIKDQGIGIPQDDQPQLFELFYRGSNISTIRGTGLGLAIVYRAVQLLQGDLQFTSTVGEGTEFVVKIPYSLPA